MSKSERNTHVLLGVGLVALAARLVYLYVLNHRELSFGLFLDSRYYADQAAMIRGGHGIGAHPYLLSPLYPYFLALFGNLDDGANLRLVQMVQAVFGAGTAVLAAAIGGRVAGRAVAVAAGTVVALYGPLIHLDSQLLVVCLHTFFLTLALWLLLDAEASRPRWLAVGLALGAAAALRPTGLIVAAAVGVVLLGRRRWRPLGALALGIAVVVAPFALRNAVRGGELVLLSANGGVNFWIGNHSGASGLYRLPEGTDHVNDPLSKLSAETAAGRELTYRENSQWWMRRAWSDIRRQPGQWLRLLGRKGIYFLHPKEIAQLGSGFHWYRDRAWPLRFPLDARWVFVFVAVLPFVGRHFSQKRLFWVWLYVLVYAAAICLFFVTGRYRLPVMPASIVLGCCGLLGLWRHVRERVLRRQAWRAALPVGLVLGLGLASHSLYLAPGSPFFVADASGDEERHQGMALSDAGRYEEAIDAYRRSLQILDNPHTRINLANALQLAGRTSEAAAEYEALLRRNPRLPLAWYNYALLLSSARQYEKAEVAFENASRIAPLMPEPHFRLGLLLLQQGRRQAAERSLARSLELAPAHAPWRDAARRALERTREGGAP